jgi:hypothetical protein
MQIILACTQHRKLQNKISPRIKYSEDVDDVVQENRNAQIINGKGNQGQKYDTICHYFDKPPVYESLLDKTVELAWFLFAISGVCLGTFSV